MDFTKASSLFKCRQIVEIKPGEMKAIGKRMVTNDSKFGMRLGFSFSRDKNNYGKLANFKPGAKDSDNNPKWNNFWGTVVVLRGRTMLLPGTASNPLTEPPRSGNLIDNFRKIGGGCCAWHWHRRA